MDVEKTTLVAATEQSLIGKVLLDIINSSNLPSNIIAQYGSLEDKESIGLFPESGAIYTKQWINGDYEAQFPCVIIHRSRPTDTIKRLQAQQVVDRIGEYLEGYPCVEIDEHRDILSIKRSANSQPVLLDDTGLMDWQIPILLKYRYRKFKKKG